MVGKSSSPCLCSLPCIILGLCFASDEGSAGDCREAAKLVPECCRSIVEQLQRCVCMHSHLSQGVPIRSNEEECRDRVVVYLREQTFETGNDTLTYNQNTTSGYLYTEALPARCPRSLALPFSSSRRHCRQTCVWLSMQTTELGGN